MKNLKKIDVAFAYNLLTLTDDSFKNMQRYMNDFCQMFFKGDKHSWVVFLDVVSSMLNIQGVRDETFSKNTTEVECKEEYERFIIQYQFLLRELVEKNLLCVLFRIMCVKDSCSYFMKFYNYLICNFDKKVQIMENLYKMYKIGIYDFAFDFEKTSVDHFRICCDEHLLVTNNVMVIVSDLTFDCDVLFSREEFGEVANDGMKKVLVDVK